MLTHLQYFIIHIHNSLQTVINRLTLLNMISRSHLMARPKQQLKQQLLANFRKKNKQQVVDIHQNQITEMASPQNNESSVSNYQSKNFFTPTNYYERDKGYLTQNRNILDQFSKCPVTEEETLFNGEQFLNKFMFTKNRPAFPTAAKTLIQVQVQTQKQKQKTNNVFISKQTPNTKAPTIKQFEKQTPPKVGTFNQKQERSLIDVSANLSNYKFPTTDAKQNLILLTDSILQNQLKYQSNHSSTEQLLKQLGEGKPAEEQKQIKNATEQISIKKVPIVKVIQLSRPKSTPQQIAQPIANKNESKQNKAINLINTQQDQQSERLDKLLTKKSLLKNLIIKKNDQNLKKQQSLPNIEERDGKWNKASKNYVSQPKIPIKNNTTKVSSWKATTVQKDPLDDLPAYQSSNSQLGLQAVIEEDENDSEMGESVKHAHHKAKQVPQPIKPKIQVTLKPNEKNLNLNKVFTSSSNGQNLVKNQSDKPQRKDSQQQLKEISLQDLQDESQQKIEIEESKKQKNKSDPKIQKKQISLSDLPDISLGDISQIKNKSESKQGDSSLKKIKQIRELSNDALPDYIDSDNEDKHSKEKADMQKYIVNNISQDINQLKDKMIRDSGIQLSKQASDVFATKKQIGYEERKQSNRQSRKGSEGPDKKVVSMLDFFDEVHEKIDFGQISKSIKDLKQKILNDSQ